MSEVERAACREISILDTPMTYVPPPPKRARRKKSGTPARTAGGPLACLDPSSQIARGGCEALDTKMDDVDRWPQAAVAGTRLSPAASPRLLHACKMMQCSAAPLSASLMPAVGCRLEDGSVGVYGRSDDRLLPATLCQGSTTERALLAPPQRSNGVERRRGLAANRRFPPRGGGRRWNAAERQSRKH